MLRENDLQRSIHTLEDGANGVQVGDIEQSICL